MYIVSQVNTLSKLGTEVYVGNVVKVRLGRCDIIFTDDSNNKGVVIELKYGEKNEKKGYKLI